MGAALTGAALTMAGPAFAQERGPRGGAPIVYAEASPAPSEGPRVLDLRRARPEAPTTAAAAAPAPASERPTWLETERVGPPYEAEGRWYVPTPEPGYAEEGVASWYGNEFQGRPTASGDVFDQEAITAAHPTLPIPSLVQVTNLENGREIIVRVNDRGPFVDERLIDLSRAGARALGFEAAGRARVHVRYLGPAPRRVEGASAPAAVSAGRIEAAPLPPTPVSPSVSAPPPPAAAPAVRSTPGGAFTVQVGAYSDLTNAQRARASLAAVGATSIEPVRTADGEVFRVRLGPYATASDADAARVAAARQGYAQAVVRSAR
jgi:rare lipoprotein A